MCFEVVRRERGYGGPYGQNWVGAVWRCVECGLELREWERGKWETARAAEHHEHGHAPCEHCGKPLALRKDSSRRQHAHNRCPGKNAGYKIEREFARNIERREYT